MKLPACFSLRFLCSLLIAAGLLWFVPTDLLSQTGPPRAQKKQEQQKDKGETPESLYKAEKEQGAFERPSLATQAVTLSLLSLLPFIIMILTSFMKIVIVLSLLRSALGVQQAPPNQIINGVAFMLSMYVMYPTGIKMYEAAQPIIEEKNIPSSMLSEEAAAYFMRVANAAKEPLRDFLKNNSAAKHQQMFYRMAYRILPEKYREELTVGDYIIIVPSFITSQLKDAFEIGVLIYIPFFVIDLVTSNILLAMGMMMLSPVTISMPLKLFLMVMLDGWSLLIQGLVTTFK